MEYIIIFIALGFLYLLFKPSRKLKTKRQKQVEIFENYKEELRSELVGLGGEELKKRKMQLLKRFADELNRNLFFDEAETRRLIQKLINGK
jgi:hypothetical protein